MCIHGVYIYIYIPHSLSVAPLCQVQLLGDWEARRQAVQALGFLSKLHLFWKQAFRRDCYLNCPLSRSACWWKQLISHFILSGISTDAAIEDMLFFSIKWYQMVRSRQKIFTWLPEALGRGKLAEGSRPGHALESHGGIIDSGWEGFLSSSSQTRQNPSMFFF